VRTEYSGKISQMAMIKTALFGAFLLAAPRLARAAA
jgi:hypothetical protein